MTTINQETTIYNLTSENKHLINFAEKVNDFFDKQTLPIIKKCVSNITQKIIDLGNESPMTHFVSESYEDLNLFEQISLVAMDGDLPLYSEVMMMIRNFCEDEIKLLNEHDRFIMSYRYRDFDEDDYNPVQEVKDAFVEYASNYTNDKLSEYR